MEHRARKRAPGRVPGAAALGLVALAALSAATPTTAPVPYPEGYRHWTHVKSMLIGPGHPLYGDFGGLHHLYANEQALDGYRSGGRFPDGSVIVFDLLAADERDHAVEAGARKIVGVMHKDSRRWAATGGWGFEGFAGGDRGQRAVGAKADTACFACHTQRQAQDYVFSEWRE